MFAMPTPVAYESLPVYSAEEKSFYRPVEATTFTPIQTFKGISIWNYYNQNPILIIDDAIIIAGHIQEPGDAWGSGINVDLVSANINTGKVDWQGQAGSAFLLKDEKHIYAEAINNFSFRGAGVRNVSIIVRQNERNK